MPADCQFTSLSYRPCEIEHRYGPNVHILKDPLALSLLATLCARHTVQPEVNRLLVELYRVLVHEVVATEVPRELAAIPTRMIEVTEHGIWEGQVLVRSTPAVVVALARAGLLPSQVTYDFLTQVLDPRGVRQDHLALGRTLDSQGRVTGAGLYASKIGGPVDGALMLIPDPMGATGSTVSRVLHHYAQEVSGRPWRVVAVHLIITPEYLRHVTRHHPEVQVYALRLDRGLSSPEVLRTIPGTYWDQERGLTDHHYIVPGAGGLGEVINNAFV
ncbi:MAG: uracil phosphoribosyltransferase [Myxococcales bacterium]|nr:uracil phosphoribosyltransferase [Myxococcota bacterium]MDW8281248.1 uracil phosphoribosyltransferase [Myxococcales bacterium]